MNESLKMDKTVPVKESISSMLHTIWSYHASGLMIKGVLNKTTKEHFDYLYWHNSVCDIFSHYNPRKKNKKNKKDKKRKSTKVKGKGIIL